MGGKVVSFGVPYVVVGLLACVSPVASVVGQSVAVGTLPEHDAKTALVTLDVKNEPVERVLRMIAQQAGLKMIFPTEQVHSDVRVTLQVRGVQAADAFARALAGTGLQARVHMSAVLISAASVGTTAAVVQGSITGKVVDGKTRQGLRGATVSLSGTANGPGKGTTTGDDGSFRVSGIVPGSYTVHVRMLGYVKATKSITVVEGQTASLEVVLEPSVNALDQVVVTGTVAATARRAIPNAITVITAQDIEARGITRIEQLFRGDIPGLFSASMGSDNPLDEVSMFSRGATKLIQVTDTLGATSNPIKIYVDGVELAEPKYLSQIDPRSIERIEVISGPQASTIYGSNAINGVMQVFTKRGASMRPQFVLGLMSGVIQNNFTPALTSEHHDDVRVSGLQGRLSYQGGASWDYMGPWTPAKQTTRLGANGGSRAQIGPFLIDVTGRYGITRNLRRGAPTQVVSVFRQTGAYSPNATTGIVPPQNARLQGQTWGAGLSYAPVSWWSHEIVLGYDGARTETSAMAPSYSRATDTLLSFSQSESQRISQRYVSTVQRPVTSLAQLSLTVGVDHWRNRTASLSATPATLTGTLASPRIIRGRPGKNTGAFAQSQIGLFDAVFLTSGVRAEWNPNYGDHAQPNLAPRVGVAVTHDLGSVTTKLRMSYGRSTRPPTETQKEALPSTYPAWIDLMGPHDDRLANPDLRPESQQGGEGGLEVYWGSRGSLVITRYNQTVDDLIMLAFADSIPSLTSHPTGCPMGNPGIDFYCYKIRNRYHNLGSIRNQGWELQGNTHVGPLSLRGTYSWTKSRIIGLAPEARADNTEMGWYEPGGTFSYLPEHTWAGTVTYSRRNTTASVTLNGTGSLRKVSNDLTMAVNSGNRLRTSTAPRVSLGNDYRAYVSGYTIADFNASHRLSSWVEFVMQVQNVADFYRNDMNANNASIGRQLKAGTRMQF